MALVILLPGPEDLGAGEVASAVRARGHDVVTLAPARLESLTWEHRLEDGRVATRITLPGGRVIDDRSVGAVLNRVVAPTLIRFARSGGRDRSYAIAEWQALLASWLGSLGDRVVGAIDGQGATPARGSLQWLAWARAAGLRTASPIGVREPSAAAEPTHRSLGRERAVIRHVVVDGRVVVPPRPVADVAEAVCRLAAYAGSDILAARLAVDGSPPTLVDVDLRPPLTGVTADAVADLLYARARRAERAWRAAS